MKMYRLVDLIRFFRREQPRFYVSIDEILECVFDEDIPDKMKEQLIAHILRANGLHAYRSSGLGCHNEWTMFRAVTDKGIWKKDWKQKYKVELYEIEVMNEKVYFELVLN